jgi:hypothetical protein
VSEPHPLYPWSRTAEQLADDERRLSVFRKLVATLRVGDCIVYEPSEMVIRGDPPSIRSIEGEIAHLGLTPDV